MSAPVKVKRYTIDEANKAVRYFSAPVLEAMRAYSIIKMAEKVIRHCPSASEEYVLHSRLYQKGMEKAFGLGHEFHKKYGVDFKDYKYGKLVIPGIYEDREIDFVWFFNEGTIKGWKTEDDNPLSRRDISELLAA